MIVSHEIVDRVFSRNQKERNVLREKHLVLVGAGSVGSALALMAARAGVEHFTLVDADTLEAENICRHFCDLEGIGRAKVDVLADHIRRVNPGAEVATFRADFRTMDREDLLAPCDAASTVLVGATDSFECQALVNLLSLETGIPAVYIGCWGEATVGEILYVVPGRTPCFECYAGFRRETEELSLRDPRKYTDLDFDQSKVPGQAGLWSSILVICGFGFQVMLGLLAPDEPRSKEIIDLTQTLFLVNVGDSSSALPLWAVTPGTVRRGCGVCDEACVVGLEGVISA